MKKGYKQRRIKMPYEQITKSFIDGVQD